jgi:hypothetical protein
MSANTQALKWTATADNEKVVIRQKGKIMTISRGEISDEQLLWLLKKEHCGGCRTLPTKGFGTNRGDWCACSRLVASLYDDGHRFKQQED